MLAQPPSSALLWDLLARAMHQPDVGEPHRPTEIQVRPDERWTELKSHLEEMEIPCVPLDELDQWDFVFESLADYLNKDKPPGLLEMPGVTPEQVASFYQAAAEFYRKAPWRSMSYESAIRIACDQFESGPWYAVVMGQSGLALGIALYDDLKMLRKVWAGQMSDEENARETVALTVLFGDQTEVSATDLEAGRKAGWEVAGSEAYPSIFRKERGMTMRPPLAWELELMEGCLRAIPQFVTQYPPEDTSTHTMAVPVASGELTLTLSWIEE